MLHLHLVVSLWAVPRFWLSPAWRPGPCSKGSLDCRTRAVLFVHRPARFAIWSKHFKRRALTKVTGRKVSPQDVATYVHRCDETEHRFASESDAIRTVRRGCLMKGTNDHDLV